MSKTKKKKTKVEIDQSDFVWKDVNSDSQAVYYASDNSVVFEQSEGKLGMRRCGWSAVARYFVKRFCKPDRLERFIVYAHKAMGDPAYLNHCFSWEYSPQGSSFWKSYYQGSKIIDEQYKDELQLMIDVMESELAIQNGD